MIKTRDVHKVLRERDIEFKTIERHGEENPWFEVQIRPQSLSNHDLDDISESLNGAIINVNIGKSSAYLGIHPYYKNY